LFIFGLILVFLRVGYFEFYEYSEVEKHYSEEVLDLNFTICAEPDYRLEKVNYIVCLDSIITELNGKRFLISTGLYPKYKYGDSFLAAGSITEPFETDEFAYSDYLKVLRVVGVIELRSGLKFIDSENSLRRNLYDFKFLLLNKIESVLNEPYASLINGLLLGARKGFTDSVTNMLTVTGLTHIVAVSGYNVSLIILFVERSLFFVPRNIRFYILFVLISVFAVIAGLSASVVRACVMGIISVMVVHYGYTNNFLRAILLTAFGMILWNPASLYFDLGFQLSFFATLGVVYLAKFVDFNWITNRMSLRESLSLTLASQLATLPTILFYFGNLSIISPLANVLIAPFLPILMLLGFLLWIFGTVPIIGTFLVLITNALSFYFFLILDFLTKVPLAMVTLPKGSKLILLICYLIIAVVLVLKSNEND
jgi:competence protein ComEC